MARLWAGATLTDVEGMIAGLEASAARGERDTLDRLAGRSARAWAIEEFGFEDWAHLEREVARREILASRDVVRLRAMLDADPGLATLELTRWSDHCHGAAPVSFVAMLRYDTADRVWRDVPGTGPVVAMLLDAGAPVDGQAGCEETPLMTAASYGDAEVAQVLVDYGAYLERRATADAGGVPGETALRHAAVFGMTPVVDVLVAAGARCEHLVDAAAAGDLAGWLAADTPIEDLVGALTMAADHERLALIDELLDAGAPIDAVDDHGRQPLRLAAAGGKVDGVRHLLARGADPNLRDEHGRTALDLARGHDHADPTRHEHVQRLLEPVTTA
jgi:ankyrin repeat protein